MTYKMGGWKGFDLSKHPVKPPTPEQQKKIKGKLRGVKSTTTGLTNPWFPKVGGTRK
jgi:hypothetical protein